MNKYINFPGQRHSDSAFVVIREERFQKAPNMPHEVCSTLQAHFDNLEMAECL